jgi:hypothetical protein
MIHQDDALVFYLERNMTGLHTAADDYYFMVGGVRNYTGLDTSNYRRQARVRSRMGHILDETWSETAGRTDGGPKITMGVSIWWVGGGQFLVSVRNSRTASRWHETGINVLLTIRINRITVP